MKFQFHGWFLNQIYGVLGAFGAERITFIAADLDHSERHRPERRIAQVRVQSCLAMGHFLELFGSSAMKPPFNHLGSPWKSTLEKVTHRKTRLNPTRTWSIPPHECSEHDGAVARLGLKPSASAAVKVMRSSARTKRTSSCDSKS